MLNNLMQKAIIILTMKRRYNYYIYFA